MSSSRFLLLAVLLLGSIAAGCQTPQAWLESMKGDGFSEWNDSLGSGFRGPSSQAKPSGFFTDRRSEQIEQSLGGSF